MTTHHTINRTTAIACLILSMSLVGSYVALSKPLTLVLPVLLLAWLRFGIGGLAMLHWLKKPMHEPLMTPQTKRLVFIESLLGNFLFSICMLYGVSMTSAVNAGIIMAMIPAVVALMSWVSVSAFAFGLQLHWASWGSCFIRYQIQSTLVNIYADQRSVFPLKY